jgi:hypothetical protein
VLLRSRSLTLGSNARPATRRSRPPRSNTRGPYGRPGQDPHAPGLLRRIQPESWMLGRGQELAE